jgi:hypothetical protein
MPCVRPNRSKKGRRIKIARAGKCLVAIQGDVLMPSDVADVSHFERKVGAELMLNGEVSEIEFGDPIRAWRIDVTSVDASGSGYRPFAPMEILAGAGGPMSRLNAAT